MINKKFCAISLAFLLCACGKKSQSQSGGNSNKEQKEHNPDRQVDPATQQGNIDTNGKGKNGQNTPNGNKEIPKKQDKNFPTGLRNLGASCYLNSSIQQLYNIEAIRNVVLNGKFGTFDEVSNKLKEENFCSDLFLLDDKQLKEKKLDDGKIKTLKSLRIKQWMIALQEMFKGMSSDSTSFDPGQLPYKLGYQGEQEDASELLLHLLDSLEKEDSSNKIKKCFDFSLVSKTEGLRCNHSSFNETKNISALNCNICGVKSLIDFLGGVDNVEDFKCEQCNNLGARKYTQFSSLPQVLIIPLGRFFDCESKLNAKFDFPLDLQINKEWCAENLSQNIPSYKLTGVIVHWGSLKSGHYWSYVKKGEKWYQCNDATVAEVNMDNTLLQTLYGDGTSETSAYILFYSKV